MHLKHLFPFLLHKFYFRNYLCSLANNYYDMHIKQHLFPFLLYQCYLLQSFPIIFIQVIPENIKEMTINTYKINCIRLACKVRCEHTKYTTTLIDEKTCKEKYLLQQVLARRGKEEEEEASTTQPRICCVCKHCFG